MAFPGRASPLSASGRGSVEQQSSFLDNITLTHRTAFGDSPTLHSCFVFSLKTNEFAMCFFNRLEKHPQLLDFTFCWNLKGKTTVEWLIKPEKNINEAFKALKNLYPAYGSEMDHLLYSKYRSRSPSS